MDLRCGHNVVIQNILYSPYIYYNSSKHFRFIDEYISCTEFNISHLKFSDKIAYFPLDDWSVINQPGLDVAHICKG